VPLQFRSIPLDPSPDGDVIHREPTLGQKLLDVPVRKREAQIPTDRQENDLRFKLAPLEQAANRRVQKEYPSLSRQACKVATLPLKTADIYDALVGQGYSFTFKEAKQVLGIRLYKMLGVEPLGDGPFEAN
jgi:hypothetical protein